ncbi:MAG: QueG-associated DUF1730 domain-containing protein [Evtepia gabavorous]
MGCRRAGRPPAVSGPGGGRTAPHPLSRGPDRAGGGLSYYAGQAPGNLSLYCRGEDYHLVLGRRLEQVCAGLRARHPSHTFVAGADNSPCRNWPRRSWPAWAAGAATGCGSSPLRLLCLLRHHSHRPGPPLHRPVRRDPLPAPLPGLSGGLPHRRPDGAGV